MAAWTLAPPSGQQQGETSKCAREGPEATSTLLNCLWARSVTRTQDLGGKSPREAGGAPSASRATASEAPKGVCERRVCAHTSVCV